MTQKEKTLPEGTTQDMIDEAKQTLPEGITQDMIDKAKVKYGADKVKFVDILNEEENAVELTVLAIVPSRNVTGQYRRYSDTDPKKADEILVKACLLSHKEQVLANDALFYGALNGIAELIPIRKANVKNC
ncbi:hypothetical protein [Paludibacter sp.]|uniref:hypothetical protein n=1 Tax=Paludibacter sp. TaxID=1898105 RepID=UPI00135590F8|nr:hypothetical protein [Paludibacter sp.]MTK53293.1 hypothetical protein [Paludibacter sp.]